jgi:hypothetical protein
MTYGRDQGRRGYRDPRSQSFDDDRYSREDRGFFDRARDEVASWFGDERAEQRRDRDDRFDDDDGFRRTTFAGDRDYGRYEQSPRFRDEGYRRPYTGRSQSRQQFGGDYGPERAFHNDRWDRGQTQQGWAGNREFTGTASGLYDRDYSTWRSRQIDELDRDYDEFRRENSSRFENEFTSWRTGRQAKKELIKQLDEHMDVVGSDGETVGKIDHVKSDKIVLTKNDSPDGRHHVIGCSRFDRVEDGKLFLDKPASEIQQGFEQQKRSRALFEDERPDDNGPHMLNRSFSGTY